MSIDKRLNLLNSSEIRAIYEYPIFSDNDRPYYLSLSEQELEIAKTLKTNENKIYFALILSYFKAKTIFFKIDLKKSRLDIVYISKTVFAIRSHKSIHIKPCKNTIIKVKLLLFKLFNIDSEKKQKQLIYEKLSALARYNITPIDIFRGLFAYMQDNNIPIPAYTTLQTLIGNIISKEELRLTNIIDRYFPKYAVKIINNLLTIQDGLYPMAALKADPKGFNTSEVRGELEKHIKCSKLFIACKKIIPEFDLSKKNLKYYADLAMYYPSFKLANFPRSKSQLYIICFVYYQSFKINNNLIDCFIHYVRKYDKKAEIYAKEEIYKSKVIMNQYQPQVGKVLTLFNKVSLNNCKFKAIKKKAFEFIPEGLFKKIIKLIKNDKTDKKEYLWDFHRENHHSAAINLRPLFMVINFDYKTISDELKQAAQFLSTTFKKEKSFSTYKIIDFPRTFMQENIAKYFFMKKAFKNKKKKPYKTIDPFKYEYFVYQQIERGIHAGNVYSNASIEYKDFDVDINLGIDKNFAKQKQIIQAAYMPALNNDIKGRLKELKKTNEELLVSVNQRINNGENKDIKIKKSKDGEIKWTLPYKKIKPDFNNPFYDKLPQINIIDLVVFVDNQCRFTNAFSHIKPLGSTKIVDYDYTIAGFLADALGFGVHEMAERSNLDYDKLFKIHASRIRLENLTEANNVLTNALEELPIFKYYNIKENIYHGGTDGRHADVKLNTFKSCYLRKYFKEKGVSSYTLLVNNAAISSKIITGHESHFLFDILFNNTSSIKPSVISTDTEGSNNLNYVLTDLIGVLFAPHYKTITKKAKTIGTFNDPKQYKDCIIKPCYRFKEDLIIEDWSNMQKIFISLLSGDHTQSTIVSKFSSHQRKNKTKDALWEYNNILRSIYLLLYIDDPELRRNVRTALNRTEAYHQLIRAIENIGRGAFRGKSDMEILIWNECTRLVANSVIYYNAYLLSQLLMNKGNNMGEEEINLLKRISPIAWQFICFGGAFDFSLKNTLNIKDLVAIITKCFNEELSKSK